MATSRNESNITIVEGGNEHERDVEAGLSSSGEKQPFPDNVVTWDGPDDPNNPLNWPRRKKITVTMLYGMTTMSATFASSIFSSSSSYVARQFGIGDEVSILGLSLFILGFAFGPVLFAPISEVYGRKLAIVIPVFIFICFSAATATAENLQTIFITRFFGGIFSSSPVTIVGGGIADMFNQRERGSMVVIYSLCIVGGPTIAPVIGSAVSLASTWRWTEYIVVILTSVVLVIDLLFLPETSATAILTKKARRLRLKTSRWALHSKHEESDHSLKAFAHKTLFLPLVMLVKEPMVLLISLYNAFAYGILYMLFPAIPIIFGENRGWGPVTSILPNLATLVGTLFAALINWVYSEKFFARYMDQHDGKAPPERRLPPMMIGSVAFPVGFFIIGWTSDPSIHWFPSLLGLALIGMSFLLIFQAGINYLIDAYTKVSASAIAANTFNRSLSGAAFPLVAMPLYHNLGIHWACTLLGCLGVLLGATPFFFYHFGSRIRARSSFIENRKT